MRAVALINVSINYTSHKGNVTWEQTSETKAGDIALNNQIAIHHINLSQFTLAHKITKIYKYLRWCFFCHYQSNNTGEATVKAFINLYHLVLDQNFGFMTQLLKTIVNRETRAICFQV